MASKKTDDKRTSRRQPTVPLYKLERNSTIMKIYPQNEQITTAINNYEAEKPNDLSKKTVRTHCKESPHRAVAVTKTKENMQNRGFDGLYISAMTRCDELSIKQENYIDDDNDAELKKNEALSPTDFTTKEQLPIRCSTRLAHRNLWHKQGQNRKNLKPIRTSNEFEDCKIKRELTEFSEGLTLKQENCLDYNDIPSKMPPTFSTMKLSVKETPADGFTTKKQLLLKEPILCLTRLEDTNLWPPQEWSHKELKTNDYGNQSSNEFKDICKIETEPTQLSESLTMKQNRKNCKTAWKRTRSSNDFEDDCNIKTGLSQRDLQQSTSTVSSEIETTNLTTISSRSGNKEQSGLGDPPGVIEYEVLIKAESEDSNDEAAFTDHSSGHDDSEAVTRYVFVKVPVEGDTDGKPTMGWVERTGNLSLNEIEKLAENFCNTKVGAVSTANWSDVTLDMEHITNFVPSINRLEDASVASDPVLELQIEQLTNSARSINGSEDASIATCSDVKSAASAIQVDKTESKEDVIHGEIWELMEDLGFVEEDIKMEDDVEDLFSGLDCDDTDTGKTVEELDIKMDLQLTEEDIKMEDDVEDLFSGLDCDDIDTGETVEEQDINIRFSPLPEQSSETEQNRQSLVSQGYGIQGEQEISTFETSSGQRIEEPQDEQQPGFTSTPVQSVARRSRSRLRSSRRGKAAAKKRALSDPSEKHERKVAKANKGSMPGSESKLTGKPLNISEGRASQSLAKNKAPRYITRSRSRCSEKTYQPVVEEEDDKEVEILLSGISKGRVAQSPFEDEAPRYITRSRSRCSEKTYQPVVEEEEDKEVEILLSGITKGRVAQSLFEDEAPRYITRSKSRCSKEAEQPMVTEKNSKEVDRRCHITKRMSRSREKAHYPLAVEEDDEEVKELLSGISKSKVARSLANNEMLDYITRSRSRCSAKTYQPVVEEEDDKEVEILLSGISKSRVAQSLSDDEPPHYYITRSKSRCSKEAEPPILAKENSKDVGKPLSISEDRVAQPLTKDEAPHHITKRKSRNRFRAHQPLAVEKDDKEVKELLSGIFKSRGAQSLDEDKSPHYHITRSRSRCRKETQPLIATIENSKDVGKPSSISEGIITGSLTKDEVPHHITKMNSRSREQAHQSLAEEEADKEVEELFSSISESRVGQSLDKDEAPCYYITRSKSRCSKEADQPIAAQKKSKVVEKPLRIFEGEASCHITKRKFRSRKGAHQPVATEDVDEEIDILLGGISEGRLAHSLSQDEAPRRYITRSKSRCREEAQQLDTPEESDKKVERVWTGISEGRVGRSLTKNVAPRYMTRSKSRCREEAQQPTAAGENARDVKFPHLGKVKDLQEDVKYFSDDTDVKKRFFYKIFIHELCKQVELKKRTLSDFSNKDSKSAKKENVTNCKKNQDKGLLKDGLLSCLPHNTTIIGKDLTSQPEALNKILRNELPMVPTAPIKANVSENTKLQVTETGKTITISVTNQGGSEKPAMGEPRDLLKCDMCVYQTAIQSHLEDHKAIVHCGRPLVLKQNVTEIRNKSTSVQNLETYNTSCNHNKIKKQLMHVQNDSGEAFSKSLICHQSQESSLLLKFNSVNAKGATNLTRAPNVCRLKIPNDKTCTETNFMKDEHTAKTKCSDSLLMQGNNEVNSTGARNSQNLRVDDSFDNKLMYQGKCVTEKLNSFHKQKPYSKQGSSENELTGSLLVQSRNETTSTSATNIQNIQDLSCRPCSEQNIEEKNNETVSFMKSSDYPARKTKTTAAGLKESIKNRLKVYTLTKEQLYTTPGMLKEVILKDFERTSNSPPKYIKLTVGASEKHLENRSCNTENLETKAVISKIPKAFHKGQIHITNTARNRQSPKANVTIQSECSTDHISKTTLSETANVSQPAKYSLDCTSQPALDQGINAGFVQASKAASARHNSTLQRKGTFKRSFSASEIENLKMVGGNNNFYSRIDTKPAYSKIAKTTDECEMQVEIENPQMYCIKQALKCIQLDHSYAKDISGPYQILDPLLYGCNLCDFSAVLATSLQDHMITFHNQVYQPL